MRGATKRWSLTLLAVLSCLGGCQGQSTGAVGQTNLSGEPTATSPQSGIEPSLATEQDRPAETPLGSSETACLHPLWPLQDGASWTYQLADSAGTAQSQLLLEAAVSGDRVTLTAAGHTSPITCADGGLNGLPPLPIGHPDLGYYSGGENPRGAFLPEPGLLMPFGTPATWDMEIRPTGTILLPENGETQETSIVDGRLVIFNQSSNLEPVVIPVGSFSAVAVTQNVFFEIQVTFPDGAQQNVLINTQVQQYYAEGIGLVKSLYQGGTVSMPDSIWTLPPGPMLELVSSVIPSE
jgi:hypothetical protein